MSMRPVAIKLLLLGLVVVLAIGASVPLRPARSGLLPAPDNPPSDGTATVGPEGYFVKSAVMIWNIVGVKGDFDVRIDDNFSYKLKDGEKLYIFSATPESRSSTGLRSSKYYCSAIVYVGGGIGKRLVPGFLKPTQDYVRYCFADDDADGKLEHVFIFGAKDSELISAHAIAAIPFTPLSPEPSVEAPTHVRVIYKRINPKSNNLLIYLRFYTFDKEYGISSSFRFGSAETRDITEHKAKINLKYNEVGDTVLPEIMGYKIVIHSVDEQSQIIRYSYRKSDRMLYLF